MELNDFSSLIEVGIALSLAVAALDSEKSYVLTIYNALFGIVTFIKDQFASIKLCDDQTFKSYKDGLTEENAKKVDYYNLDRAALKKEIDDVEKDIIENDVSQICSCPQIRKSNLWTALYGFICLFLSGLKNGWGDQQYFWVCLATLSLLSLIVIWTIGKNWFKIQGTLIWFLICIILSFVFAICASINKWDWLYQWEYIYIPCSVLLIYINILGIVITACHRVPRLKKKTIDLVKDYNTKSADFDSSMIGIVKAIKGEHFFDIEDIKIDKTDIN
jgi:hypothetical protein